LVIEDFPMALSSVPEFDTLKFGEAALRLRAHRHELLSANMVNANTPGFKSRDVNFPEVLAQALRGGLPASGHEPLKRTHAAHLEGTPVDRSPMALYRVPVQPSIDGNTVDPDLERGHFVKNAFMTEATLGFLGSSFRSRLSAITGQSS
jgi:flagellar basal-body rod protein FlgB